MTARRPADLADLAAPRVPRGLAVGAAIGVALGIAAILLRGGDAPAPATGPSGQVAEDLSDRSGAPEAAPAADPAPTPRAKPTPARPARTPRRGAVVLSARWGGGADELGHRRGSGSPEGPMSFVVGPDGAAVVLDQVNSRIQIFGPDGPIARPLPRETFEDLALRGDGGVVVLDRLGEGVLLALGGDGSDRGSTALRGDGVDDPGAVTGLFHRSDGAWVEVGHGGLVQILDADGRAPATRQRLAGRPLAGEASLTALAARSGPSGAQLALRAAGEATPRALVELEFDLPLWQITALEGTADGGVVVGVDLVLEDPAPPHDLLDHREAAVVVGADGRERARIDLVASDAPEESLRRLRVGADGSLYHLAFADDGATLWRYVL